MQTISFEALMAAISTPHVVTARMIYRVIEIPFPALVVKHPDKEVVYRPFESVSDAVDAMEWMSQKDAAWFGEAIWTDEGKALVQRLVDEMTRNRELARKHSLPNSNSEAFGDPET